MLVVMTGIAQPSPCDMANPEMTSTCIEACVICDIDGFTGRHESDVQGVLPPDFCTMQVHNGQWIAFQAASTNLTIRMSVSNCQLGSGLELGLYESLDCENFTLISNCRGAREAVPEGSSAEFENIVPLVVGQFYYLALDGNRADNCDWTFEVLSGSTEVSPLTVTPNIEGDNIICNSMDHMFSFEAEEGSVLFDWTLDGVFLETTNQPSITVNIDQPAVYELCAQAKNACDEATPSCREVEVITIPITSVTDFFCEEECYDIAGMQICESGEFTVAATSAIGCDSVIVLSLIELPQAVNNVSLNICEGDTVFIGNTPYTTEGSFTQTLQSERMCDSLVNLDLRVIICDIQSGFDTRLTTCFRGSDGEATFQVINGTPPFTYTWQHLQRGLNGSGQLSDILIEETITNLPLGNVAIEINDEFGNSDVILLEIKEPDLIEVESAVSQFNGFNTSCNDSADGAITLEVTGGIAPYDYLWPEGQTTSRVNDLLAGDYEVTLTDALGCEHTQRITLTNPDVLDGDVVFQDPNCDGLETGEVIIRELEGGVGPYQNALNNNGFIDNLNYSNLPAGPYTLTILDSNGCTIDIQGELEAPQIPELSGVDIYETQLGCAFQIIAQTNNVDLTDIRWLDSSYLSCDDCLEPMANPTDNGTNVLFVTSSDDCTDSLRINISVEKRRAFYAPNVFNPRTAQPDNRFSILGGKEVLSITLAIYDRWGNVVFSQENMNPNADQSGWDGRYNQQLVDAGTYTWLAEITFLDGVMDVFSGDITIIK